MNKKFGHILIAFLLLFFPTYVLAEIDSNEIMIEFLDSLNNQNTSKALSCLTDLKKEEAPMMEDLLKLHTEIFGKIEIIDILSPSQFNIQEVCAGDRCMNDFAITTEYFENQSNPVVYTWYKVKYEKAGQGFLQIHYPGDEKTGKITEAKMARVTVFTLKEGNLMQTIKFSSGIKKLVEDRNGASNP